MVEMSPLSVYSIDEREYEIKENVKEKVHDYLPVGKDLNSPYQAAAIIRASSHYSSGCPSLDDYITATNTKARKNRFPPLAEESFHANQGMTHERIKSSETNISLEDISIEDSLFQFEDDHDRHVIETKYISYLTDAVKASSRNVFDEASSSFVPGLSTRTLVPEDAINDILDHIEFPSDQAEHARIAELPIKEQTQKKKYRRWKPYEYDWSSLTSRFSSKENYANWLKKCMAATFSCNGQ
eukprot:CAMPEP_0113322614 /NCGR_PEP_ID=MMETSP0010_2-20120614/15729_1 /TAXON_ID=216773 ORGANISM="Corethron hystrix, Strain 308" /NCGR_SAMPLE_ID=MMETSP0010_2 /ASSEMBLY_ACC=CAM_ASM_000155 /LENGTH=240 /DNA_ID=CAMNT_0000181185 /DNA_START=389 /DNA_END=1108 /DNA_ORIENTATION=- /assembly_acc=CAM_ASM_000155